MADKLKDFPANRRNLNINRFLDGAVWHLKRGVDFSTDTGAMRQCLYAAARRLGVKARVQMVDGNNLVVQATKKKK
jgi:phage baseplate assembly protein gpV